MNASLFSYAIDQTQLLRALVSSLLYSLYCVWFTLSAIAVWSAPHPQVGTIQLVMALYVVYAFMEKGRFVFDLELLLCNCFSGIGRPTSHLLCIGHGVDEDDASDASEGGENKKAK